MIDTAKARWEFSSEDRYIFEWLEKNGFDAVLEKQNITTMRVRVSRDGFTSVETFPSGRRFDVKAFMDLFAKQFELFCKLEKMKK